VPAASQRPQFWQFRNARRFANSLHLTQSTTPFPSKAPAAPCRRCSTFCIFTRALSPPRGDRLKVGRATRVSHVGRGSPGLSHPTKGRALLRVDAPPLVPFALSLNPCHRGSARDIAKAPSQGGEERSDILEWRISEKNARPKAGQWQSGADRRCKRLASGPRAARFPHHQAYKTASSWGALWHTTPTPPVVSFAQGTSDRARPVLVFTGSSGPRSVEASTS
jgi:hypothetical protein